MYEGSIGHPFDTAMHDIFGANNPKAKPKVSYAPRKTTDASTPVQRNSQGQIVRQAVGHAPTPAATIAGKTAPAVVPGNQAPGTVQIGVTAYTQAYNEILNSLGGPTKNGATAAAQAAGSAAYQQAVTQASSTTQAQQSAQGEFTNDLISYGFTTAQAASLTAQAQGWITGAGMPNGLPAAPDQIDTLIYDSSEFHERFPAIFALQAKGIAPPSPQAYVAYEQQAYGLAQQAGLPAGFMNQQTINNLIANNVSYSELAGRLTTAYQAVAETSPQTLQYFQDVHGIGPGGLAAYFLNPDTALPVLENQATAAQIGGAGIEEGFGTLAAKQTLLAAQSGVTGSEAQKGLNAIAPELALTRSYGFLGSGVGSLTTEQLADVGLGIGGEAPQEALVQAAQKRASSVSGGGGYAATARGTGVGSARETGSSNQGA
jgi:hypothetical protein